MLAIFASFITARINLQVSVLRAEFYPKEQMFLSKYAEMSHEHFG